MRFSLAEPFPQNHFPAGKPRTDRFPLGRLFARAREPFSSGEAEPESLSRGEIAHGSLSPGEIVRASGPFSAWNAEKPSSHGEVACRSLSRGESEQLGAEFALFALSRLRCWREAQVRPARVSWT